MSFFPHGNSWKMAETFRISIAADCHLNLLGLSGFDMAGNLHCILRRLNLTKGAGQLLERRSTGLLASVKVRVDVDFINLRLSDVNHEHNLDSDLFTFDFRGRFFKTDPSRYNFVFGGETMLSLTYSELFIFPAFLFLVVSI